MNEIKRKFNGSDVNMLTAASTIIEQAIAEKVPLVAQRPKWQDPFFPNLQSRIDLAFSKYLGIDNAKPLRDATAVVLSIQAKSIKDLSFFKVQIEEDFKKNKSHRDEILNSLGFTMHYKDVKTKDQEALIELLYKFKENMLDALKNEIIEAGMVKSLIDGIINQAATLKTSNVSQETFKGGRKSVTQVGIIELNDIYDEIISVGRISSKIFIDDPAKQSQFIYSTTLKKLKIQPEKPKPTPPPPPTP